ncbi:restriction endonuclease subunit S [Pseudarthrobacter psychrotolerans]|uniref:Restriction endonuclease subunit S n=1 Tax=Pseudarthrobacter psychrotolerans TaxID=2697569 RepID=A0A6P1NJS1_9MICC|nr:restriction endonuclease subunit S [Pseudarthrobacter psychrotolerans]QHK19839.1 restriction endonuclease subunit S [Pseudarthrobacter psychrotolerans]
MSRVDDLIAELCPNGVDFKALGEMGLIFGGLSGKSKAHFTDGNARFISYVNIFNNAAVDVGATDFVHIEPGERQRTLQRGDILFTASSETAAEVGMSSVITTELDDPLYLNSFSIGYRLNEPDLLEPDFAKHLFRSTGLRKQLIRTASGVTRFNISKPRLAAVRIPVPPLPVQREIVKILDLFNGLETELEAELNARRLQYAHYRESLYDFRTDSTVRRVPMGELGQFIRGRRFTKTDRVDVGIPSIHYGEIYTHYGVSAVSAVSHIRSDMHSQLRYAQPGDVVIASVGETVKDVGKAVAWLGQGDAAIHDDSFLFRHKMDPKFVSYFLQTEAFHTQKGRYVSRAKVKRLSGDSLAKIYMPVVPIDEQERIVSILDKFEILVNDQNAGIPAEQHARRKQYEHYRDHLLTFSELAS